MYARKAVISSGVSTEAMVCLLDVSRRDVVWRCGMEMWYGDVVWRCVLEMCSGDGNVR